MVDIINLLVNIINLAVSDQSVTPFPLQTHNIKLSLKPTLAATSYSGCELLTQIKTFESVTIITVTYVTLM